MNFGWHLQTAIITSTEMTVASRAVAMTVMTEARTVDVKQEGLVSLAISSLVSSTVIYLVVER